MGMGEPLANYKAVIGAVRRLTDPAPDGLGMSARGITVSTVGLVPAMRQARRRGHPGHARAVAARARRRAARQLVPINTRWKVAEALDAAYRYFEATGRRVSHRVRADPRHQRPGLARRPARQAAQRARPRLGARQPDPAEPDARARSGRPATRAVERDFVERLRAHGIPTTVRDTRGREIDGACGQLAAVTAVSRR